MNLAMRILVSTLIIVLLATVGTLAQTPTTKSAGNPADSKAPTTTTKPRITTPTPKSIERATNTTGSTDRSKSETSPAAETSTQRASLKPSATSLRNSASNRPSAYSKNKQTAKNVERSAKRVPAIQIVEKATVHWMTLEEALERSKTEKRKIFVDVFTDWCGWCKHMDSTTFVNPTVAGYLNEHYYPVKLNAEQSEDIIFKDKVYHFKKTGSRGYHELAGLWLNNRLSFPTVVFLDENQNLIQPVPGYQDATKMEAIINYFGSDSHRKTPWETYEKNFSGN